VNIKDLYSIIVTDKRVEWYSKRRDSSIWLPLETTHLVSPSWLQITPRSLRVPIGSMAKGMFLTVQVEDAGLA